MLDYTIVVDLDERQSLKEFTASLDLLEACLGQPEQGRHPPRCPYCASWVPAGALICWRCRQIIGMVEA